VGAAEGYQSLTAGFLYWSVITVVVKRVGEKAMVDI